VDGVLRLRYVAYRWDHTDMPERIADSFSGRISRSIQTPAANGFDYWYPVWRPSGQPDKPWDVEYRALNFPYDSAQVPTVALCRKGLQDALSAAEAY
jgi:hypothetical protein